MDMIRKVEAERDAAYDNAGQVGMLNRLSGIAAISAHVLVNEVFHRAFANRRQVAAYCGLTSSPYNSGARIREQGISRAGNRRARCTAVELALLWLRFQPGSRLSRWFHERVGEARGRFKRIMIVALARKLMAALWRYLATGIVPQGATVKA
jgi:transposase